MRRLMLVIRVNRKPEEPGWDDFFCGITRLLGVQIRSGSAASLGTVALVPFPNDYHLVKPINPDTLTALVSGLGMEAAPRKRGIVH